MSTPEKTDILVVFFGPGYGESILIHLGDDNWIIIDSCLADNGESAPIAHLKSIGVDPASSVKLVLATHWHDDHIKGLASVLAACSGARFAVSSAMSDIDFLAYLQAYEVQPQTKLDRGGSEFLSCLKLMKETKRPIKFISQDTVISSWDEGALSHGCRVELLALSPSHGLFADFLASLKSFFGSISRIDLAKNPPKARIGKSGRNDLSIAALLTIGSFAVLLGADVEMKTEADRGWKDIVSARKGRSPRPHIFKVAHHGSDGAHCEDLWECVLSQRPTSIVTPWRVGGAFLPSDAAKAHLASASNGAYITSAELPSIKRRYDRTSLKLVEDGGVRIVPSLFKCGSVTLRIDPTTGEILDTVLMNGAARLTASAV